MTRAIDDIEAWAEDEAAYAEYERTGEAIPIAAVEEWVKSWGTADELRLVARMSEAISGTQRE